MNSAIKRNQFIDELSEEMDETAFAEHDDCRKMQAKKNSAGVIVEYENL